MNAYQEFRMIGSRPVRPDGLDKVTGRARYGADLNMQGQLYGHVVRSPHAHAVIKSIDCSKALAMEGVLAVMTGDDLVKPGNEMLGSGEGAMALKDVVPMVMSQGKVLFHSQAVAAVAATSPELAAEAAQVVEVMYDVLPAVTDLHKALAADAPILHDDRFPDGYPEEPTNLATHISLTVGDPDAAFRKSRGGDRAYLLGAHVPSGLYRAPRVRGTRRCGRPRRAVVLYSRTLHRSPFHCSRSRYGHGKN